jgi:hypothetical protein
VEHLLSVNMKISPWLALLEADSVRTFGLVLGQYLHGRSLGYLQQLIAVEPRLWTDQTCYPGLRRSSGQWSWVSISQPLLRIVWSTAYDSGRRLPDMFAVEDVE